VGIDSFDTEPQDNPSGRDALIQEVLYDVSEIFAPFDVAVQRIYGAGTYGQDTGDTTIFVGGESQDQRVNSIEGGVVVEYVKYANAFTPNTSTDNYSPGHPINSDPFDVGFVDPVQGFSTMPGGLASSEYTGSAAGAVDPMAIAESIAHEAGHTFGLVHVRSDGLADPAIPSGGGTVDDIMAYDASNVYFANKDLAITAYNADGSGPNGAGSFDGATQR
jgi:hypothetical protein